MNDFSYFTKALNEVFEAELDEYMESIDTDVVFEFSEKNSKKIKKLVKQREKPYYNLISTSFRRVACVLVAVIVLSMSSLSVKAVREAVYDFFMRIFSNHTEVTANKENNSEEDITESSDYPKTIEHEYIIEDLPDGFELVEYNNFADSVNSVYFRDEDYIILYQRTKDAYKANYDNERSNSYYLEDDGQQYLVFEMMYEDTVIEYDFIWDNGDYIFEIAGNLDKDTILQLCKSTKMK